MSYSFACCNLESLCCCMAIPLKHGEFIIDAEKHCSKFLLTVVFFNKHKSKTFHEIHGRVSHTGR